MRSVRGYVATAVKTSAYLIGVLAAAPVLAMADSAKFDIPAEALPAALKEFAAQSHMQLLYQFDAVSGIKSEKVAGEMDKHAALQWLLRNTGLQVTFTAPDAATITPGIHTSSTETTADVPAKAARHDSGALRLAQAAAGEATEAAPVEALQEVIVTAQHRSENLQNVPISLTALTQTDMDAKGVRTIDDIASLTPGVTLTRGNANNGMSSDISIRGIDSQAGSATTGIYIDDTPIQARSVGYSSFSTFPQVFDLERVEVLRGPQGTLFGAGSEGGTVRFITPQPSLTRTSAYVRSELSYTEDGEPNYETGAAFGTPVSDTVAMRVSAWYRRDGGWVNRSSWNQDDSAHEATGIVDSNSNWQNTAVLRAALLWAPLDNVTITPSVYYQNQRMNDTPFYWKGLSNPDAGVFLNGNLLPSTSTDRFYLPALKIDWSFAGMRLMSNTSYFDRNNQALNDYSEFEVGVWSGVAASIIGNPNAATPYPPAGFTPAPAYQRNRQNNITEELRLSSDDPSARVSWLTGLYFSRESQLAGQMVQDTALPGFIQARTGLTPQDLFGQGLYQGLYTFYAAPIESRDWQVALFGQTDIKLLDKLTLTAGVRVADAKVQISGNYAGPVVGPPVHDTGSQESHPVTPKAGLSWKFDQSNMVYTTVAKGFRTGGYNPRVGVPCAGDLSALGLSSTPQLYGPDSVWSYEIGSKNDFLGHRVRLDSSVYYINWKSIQQNIALPCGFQFVSNLGGATSKGFDIQGDFVVTDNLLLDVTVGYTNAAFTQTVKAGPAATTNLASDGDHLVGWPWTGTVSGIYNFKAMGQDAYLRLTYKYQARQNSMVINNNPADNSAPIGEKFFQLPTTSQLSARAGVRWSGFDVSLFGNNLTNSRAVLQQTVSAQETATEPLIIQQSGLLPRTVGLTATYHY